jgi:hypothetical protein
MWEAYELLKHLDEISKVQNDKQGDNIKRDSAMAILGVIRLMLGNSVGAPA